jgi:hypothetical protein
MLPAHPLALLGDFWGRDVFEEWRLILGTVCTIYAVVVTTRSIYGWIAYFTQPDRTTNLMRQYVIVQLLRLRIRPFAWELVQIAFWSLASIVLLRWQL